MLTNKQLFLSIIVALIIIACADSSDPIRKETQGWTAEQIYNGAETAVNKGEYARAIKLYNVLEYRYAGSNYAPTGLLHLSYAYYQNDQIEQALNILNRFMQIYPTHPNMDYALYLEGFINYRNDNGLLSKYTKQDLSERDNKVIYAAYNAFNKLVTNYPNSRYSFDARDKMNRLIAALARAELYKASYYMTIKAYLAAISRANNIIVNYPNSDLVEEALAIQSEAYHNIGEESISTSLNKVLAINFPHSIYLNKSWHNQGIAWYAIWH
jgi:outer membrane protein assembly factor BamD